MIPLVYLPDGDRRYIFASKAGSPTHPDWYHNLVANPDVTVEVGTEMYDATAVVITGEERDQIYSKQAEAIPTFGDYQQKTSRIIPVIRTVNPRRHERHSQAPAPSRGNRFSSPQ